MHTHTNTCKHIQTNAHINRYACIVTSIHTRTHSISILRPKISDLPKKCTHVHTHSKLWRGTAESYRLVPSTRKFFLSFLSFELYCLFNFPERPLPPSTPPAKIAAKWSSECSQSKTHSCWKISLPFLRSEGLQELPGVCRLDNRPPWYLLQSKTPFPPLAGASLFGDKVAGVFSILQLAARSDAVPWVLANSTSTVSCRLESIDRCEEHDLLKCKCHLYSAAVTRHPTHIITTDRPVNAKPLANTWDFRLSEASARAWGPYAQ